MQILLFPVFGLTVTLGQNLVIGLVFTAVSIVRSYLLRGMFERLLSGRQPRPPCPPSAISAQPGYTACTSHWIGSGAGRPAPGPFVGCLFDAAGHPVSAPIADERNAHCSSPARRTVAQVAGGPATAHPQAFPSDAPACNRQVCINAFEPGQDIPQ